MMKVIIAAIAFLGVVGFSNEHVVKNKDELKLEELREVPEDATLLVPELLKKYGYPCETHNVTAGGGYKLVMHRVPHGKQGPTGNRPAVYLQHGLLSSSADWVLYQEKGLLYTLLNAGYDVWMPNVRGTRYSRSHNSLDPDHDAKYYWDFSWHDIAVEDVPTMIDYVINHVQQDKIFYIGHSQGTTVFYVMCSELPEYNDKIRAMFSLAPIAYMEHMKSPLMRFAASFNWFLDPLLNLIGAYEFLPQSSLLTQFGAVLCSDNSLLQPLCVNSLFVVCGFNADQMNTSLIPTIMGHTPAGAATKQLLHFAQLHNSGYFRQWDYGLFENLRKYGSIWPPEYDLGRVTAPVYLYYSGNDWLSAASDVETLARELGNVVGKFHVIDDKFNHVDYLYGKDAYRYLYVRIISLMSRH